MKVVIAGGGKVGLNLARIMLEKKYYVSVIEREKDKCAKLANALDAEIICGDCTTVSVLEAAGTHDCECFMAVTGSDQDNLVAAQLARNYFGAKKLSQGQATQGILKPLSFWGLIIPSAARKSLRS